MDMLDVVALCGLEWFYDKVEERYGRAAAWLATFTVAIAVLAAIVAFIVAIL